MTGSTTNASRPEYPRSHRDAPNRRGAHTRANVARRQRLFGAIMMLLIIATIASSIWLFTLGGHPCLDTDGFADRACIQQDNQMYGLQWLGFMINAGLFIWAIRRLWKGI